MPTTPTIKSSPIHGAASSVSAMHDDALRIGQDIHAYVPQMKPLYQDMQASSGSSSAFVHRYYDMGSDLGQVRVSEAQSDGSISVEFPENTGTTTLWSDDKGRVYWEQRETADGHFRNALDRDHNGWVDYIASGRRGQDALTVKRPTQKEATLLQKQADTTRRAPPPAERDKHFVPLQMSPGQLRVSLFPSDDESRVTFVLRDDPDNSFFPSFADGVSMDPLFLEDDGAVESRIVDTGLEITVKNPKLAVWTTSPPRFQLKNPGAEPVTVSVTTPEIWLEDDTDWRAGSLASVAGFAQMLASQSSELSKRVKRGLNATLGSLEYLTGEIRAKMNQYERISANRSFTKLQTRHFAE